MLDDVLELQSIDLKILNLKSEILTLENSGHLNKIRLDLQSQKNLNINLQNEANTLRKQIKSLENNDEDLSIKLEKTEARIFDGSISNQKELESVQSEIKYLKSMKDENETILINELDKLDELNSDLALNEEKVVSLENKIEEATKDLAIKKSKLDYKVSNLSEERDLVYLKVSPESLKVYDELAEMYPGTALVKVNGNQCGGCHMKLSSSKIDEISTKEAEHIYCDECGRLLLV